MRPLSRRVGRVVEGTPLLREQTGKTCLEGSNPLLSAIKKKHRKMLRKWESQ